MVWLEEVVRLEDRRINIKGLLGEPWTKRAVWKSKVGIKHLTNAEKHQNEKCSFCVLIATSFYSRKSMRNLPCVIWMLTRGLANTLRCQTRFYPGSLTSA